MDTLRDKMTRMEAVEVTIKLEVRGTIEVPTSLKGWDIGDYIEEHWKDIQFELPTDEELKKACYEADEWGTL